MEDSERGIGRSGGQGRLFDLADHAAGFAVVYYFDFVHVLVDVRDLRVGFAAGLAVFLQRLSFSHDWGSLSYRQGVRRLFDPAHGKVFVFQVERITRH